MSKLNFFKSKTANLNPIKGGVATDAVTNSHGQITKSASSFDADNKTSDTDTSTSVVADYVQP